MDVASGKSPRRGMVAHRARCCWGRWRQNTQERNADFYAGAGNKLRHDGGSLGDLKGSSKPAATITGALSSWMMAY